MIRIRESNTRGFTDIGWLKSFHTFSFGEYFDPPNHGFSDLRVINDDYIAPSGGFGTHPHRDMEIFTYVLEGELEHKDSMGNGSVIRAGDVQVMSAGTGVTHSEFNPSDQNGVHLLQIWIFPDQKNLAPSYQQKHFDAASKRGKLLEILSQNGENESLTLHQDVRVYAGLFDGPEKSELSIQKNRAVYIHIATGAITINGNALEAGDAAALQGESLLTLSDGKNAEVLVFDLREKRT